MIKTFHQLRLTLLALLLLGASWIGCGGDGNGGGGGNAAPPPPPAPTTATIQVDHVLTRTVPANVDTFVFLGFNSSGAQVYGPDSRAKAARILLTVPLTMTSLTINYLSNGVVVGTFSQPVALTAGGTLVINDPSFVDVGGGGGGGQASAGLTRLNQLRAIAGLPPVTENQALTQGCLNHAIYMVRNDRIEHDEDPNLPFFTPEGQVAARESNLSVTTVLDSPIQDRINSLMVGPFHGCGFIDPKLDQTGIGYFSEAGTGIQTGLAVNVLGSLNATPGGFPILWPGDGATVDLRSFDGNETPDPLAGIGFTAPTGVPLYVQLGPGNVTPNVTAFSLRERGGNNLQVAEFDQTNFIGANAAEQTLGRAVLAQRSCIVLLPRDPLLRSTTYDASVTTNGNTINWSFTVSANAARQERGEIR